MELALDPISTIVMAFWLAAVISKGVDK